MGPSINQGAFVAYALTCLVLCANLFALWTYSGAVRNTTRKTANEEDAALYKMDHAEFDPPPVARVLRAHRNAEASIYPFLLLGLAYVMAGGGPLGASILFGIFVAARLAHSIAYVARMQPLRTICFVIAGIDAVALMVALAVRLLAIGG